LTWINLVHPLRQGYRSTGIAGAEQERPQTAFDVSFLKPLSNSPPELINPPCFGPFFARRAQKVIHRIKEQNNMLNVPGPATWTLFLGFVALVGSRGRQPRSMVARAIK
jgi:hypothetical protein